MTRITWCLHVDCNKTNIIFDVVPLSRPMLCLLLHVGEQHCTAVSCHAVHKWFSTGTTMGNGRGGILTRSFSLACAPPENHLLLLLVLVFSSANTFSTHLTYEMLFFCWEIDMVLSMAQFWWHELSSPKIGRDAPSNLLHLPKELHDFMLKKA